MSMKLRLNNIELELKQLEPRHYEINLNEQREVREIIKALLDRFNKDIYLMSINAIDYPDKGVIELRYLFWSIPLQSIIDIRTHIPRDKPVAQSLVELIPGAKPYEQEIYDLFGVVFEGNKWLRDGFFKPPEMGSSKPLLKQAPGQKR